MRKLVHATAILTLCVFSGMAAKASSTTYNASFTSDMTPASATATFTLTGPNQLQVVLTDTTLNSYEESQILSAFAFTLKTGATSVSGTLTGISGNTISSTPLNTNVSGLITTSGASLTATPWDTNFSSGASGLLHGAGITGYNANVGPAGNTGNIAQYGIVGTASGSPPEYTVPTTNCLPNCGTTREFGSNSNDSPLIYGTATFTYTLSANVTNLADTSLCTAGQTCISLVQFGFGPDGPDGTDVTQGVLGTTTNPTPEPGSVVLLGTGIMALAGFARKRFTT